MEEIVLLDNNLTKVQHSIISGLRNLKILKLKGLDTTFLLAPLPNVRQLECYNLKRGVALGEKFPNLKKYQFIELLRISK